jgi:hypothetical protein
VIPFFGGERIFTRSFPSGNALVFDPRRDHLSLYYCSCLFTISIIASAVRSPPHRPAAPAQPRTSIHPPTALLSVLPFRRPSLDRSRSPRPVSPAPRPRGRSCRTFAHPVCRRAEGAEAVEAVRHRSPLRRPNAAMGAQANRWGE